MDPTLCLDAKERETYGGYPILFRRYCNIIGILSVPKFNKNQCTQNCLIQKTEFHI
jgi:hypothetical protein